MSRLFCLLAGVSFGVAIQGNLPGPLITGLGFGIIALVLTEAEVRIAALRPGPGEDKRPMRPTGGTGMDERTGNEREAAVAKEGQLGAMMISHERKRQMEGVAYDGEGYTISHDDEHDGGELVGAAIAYLSEGHPGMWPFERASFKPSTLQRDLVKAGALIAAEIDRLARAAPGPGEDER